MKYFRLGVAVVAAGLLAGCGAGHDTADSPAPTPSESAVTQAPDPTDAFQPLPVNMVAQSGTYFPNGVSGVPFGCSDTLVTITTVPLRAESTQEAVTGAVSFLLDDHQYYHGDPAVTNSLTMSENLDLLSVDVSLNSADLALTGDLVVRGQCEAYRIQAQLYGTVTAVSQLTDVSITIDDVELNDVLGLPSFDTTGLLTNQ